MEEGPYEEAHDAEVAHSRQRVAVAMLVWLRMHLCDGEEQGDGHANDELLDGTGLECESAEANEENLLGCGDELPPERAVGGWVSRGIASRNQAGGSTGAVTSRTGA